MIRVILPTHLRNLAGVGREVILELESPVGIGAVLDEIENRYPMLRGTIRDQIKKQRRPFIRFFVCGEDWSHEPVEQVLPAALFRGEEPLRIVGAMAGG